MGWDGMEDTMDSINDGQVVVVIGGEGFVGHALLVDLHARYSSSITLYSSSRTQRFTSPHWTFVPCNLTSLASLTSLLDTIKPSSIFLSAASHFESSYSDAFNVNVTGTQYILDAIRQQASHTVKRLVYTSSTSVIFNGSDVEDGREDMEYPQPHQFPSYYSASKAEGEKLIMQANGKNGLYTTAIRPSGMIGAGDTTVLPQGIQVMKNGHGFIQIGSNTNLCDFDHIHNITHGHILAWEKLLPQQDGSPGAASGQVFNITTGHPIEMFTFLRTIWFLYNGYRPYFILKIPFIFGLLLAYILEGFYWMLGWGKPKGLNRSSIIYACAARWHNIDKAKELLGYQPVVGRDEGIKLAVEAYIEEEQKSKLKPLKSEKNAKKDL